MDLLKIFSIGFGSAAAALAATAWLIQRWINQQLPKDKQNYEARLAQKPGALKSELSRHAHDQGIALTAIDPQRSEKILLLCSMVGDWQDVIRDLTSPDQHFDQDPGHAVQRYYDRARKLMTLSDRLSMEVRYGAIFIRKAAYELVARHWSELREATNKFYAATFGDLELAAAQDLRALLVTVQSERQYLRAAVKDNVDDLQGLLVYEFRALRRVEKAAATRGMGPTWNRSPPSDRRR